MIGSVAGILLTKNSKDGIFVNASHTSFAGNTTYETAKREDITFILGEDRNNANPYYREAGYYYSLNPEGKTEQLVKDVRSLQEVGEYLKAHKPANGLPWGIVNLVSHGNQWTGLSVKVTPSSKRATPARILEHISDRSLQPLPNDILDEQSEIFLHGCGVGNNAKLLTVISLAFGGPGRNVNVRASKLYEYYTSEKHGNIPQKSERFVAESYSLSFKMGYQPDQQTLVDLLTNQNTDTDIDWEDALSRERPRWPGDTYHFTFQVPVKWVVPFVSKDSMPDVSTKSLQIAWINSRPEITEKLKELELPADKFNWWFRKVYVTNDDGSKSPAIWLKGYCTILSVLRPLTESADSHRPLQPDPQDAKYFAVLGTEWDKFNVRPNL